MAPLSETLGRSDMLYTTPEVTFQSAYTHSPSPGGPPSPSAQLEAAAQLSNPNSETANPIQSSTPGTPSGVDAHVPTGPNTHTSPNNNNANTPLNPPLSSPTALPQPDTVTQLHPQTAVPRASQAPVTPIVPPGSNSNGASGASGGAVIIISSSSASLPHASGSPGTLQLHTRQLTTGSTPSVAPGSVGSLPGVDVPPAPVNLAGGASGDAGGAVGESEGPAPIAPTSTPGSSPVDTPPPGKPDASAPAPSSAGTLPSPSQDNTEDVPNPTASPPSPSPTPDSAVPSSNPAPTNPPTPTPSPPTPSPTALSSTGAQPSRSSAAPAPSKTAIDLSGSTSPLPSIRPDGPLPEGEEASSSSTTSTSVDASLPTTPIKSPSQGQVAVVSSGDDSDVPSGSSNSSSPSSSDSLGNSGTPAQADDNTGGGDTRLPGEILLDPPSTLTLTSTSTFTSSLAVATSTDARGRVETSFSRVVGTRTSTTVVTVVPGPRGSGVAKGSFEENAPGNAKAAIGGSVVGAVLLLVGLLVGVVWLRRRKYRREMAVHRRLFESPVPTPEPPSPSYLTQHTPVSTNPALAQIPGRPLVSTLIKSPFTSTSTSTNTAGGPSGGGASLPLPLYNENQVRRVAPPVRAPYTNASANANPFADPPQPLVAAPANPNGARPGLFPKITYPALVPSKLGMGNVTAASNSVNINEAAHAHAQARSLGTGKRGVVWWDEKGKRGEIGSGAGTGVGVVSMPVFGVPVPTPAPAAYGQPQSQARGQARGEADLNPFADPVPEEHMDVQRRQENPFEDGGLLRVTHAEHAGSERRVSVESTESGRDVAPGYAL